MATRSFKIGGRGKSVVTVSDVGSDAGTMPAVDVMAEFANSLTSEQAIRLYDAADPLSHLDRTEIEGMTDGGLLDALEQGDLVTMGVEDASVPGADLGDADFGSLVPYALLSDTDAAKRDALLEVANNGAGGSVILDGVGDVVSSLACEPDMVNVLAALRADDDGMGCMMPIMNAESIVVSDVLPSLAEPVVSDSEAFDALVDIVALDAEFEGESALIDAPAADLGEYGLGMALSHGMDCYGLEGEAARATGYSESGLRIDDAAVHHAPIRVALDISALDLARFVGGATVELTFGGVVIGTMLPANGDGGGKRGKASRAGKVASNGVATPSASKAARDWLAFDARAVWGDSDKPWSKGYVKVWTAIRDAAERLDIDSLRAFDFAGARDDASGNSFSKSNGSYLRAQIARVAGLIAERDAALDAEFGFKLAAD